MSKARYRGIRVFDHSNQNVWLHRCSASFCQAHLKSLPQVAITSTSNYIHEEEGKHIIICINWYQMFAYNISNSSQSIAKFFFCLQASEIVNKFFPI